MKNVWLLLSVFIFVNAYGEDVCLTINSNGTYNEIFPNKARNVENSREFFKVHDGEVACFELDKSYYMQYFLQASDRWIVYGTRCRYNPKREDEGKFLNYIGYNGTTPCPITDEILVEEEGVE